MTMKYLITSVLLLACLASHAQRESLNYRSNLDKFKKHGAMVVSPDTQLVSILKEYIDFGPIYARDEVSPSTFKGVYILEFVNGLKFFTYNTYATAGYFLVINEKYMKAHEQPGSLAKSEFLVAMRVPGDIREKLPLYATVFNKLIHLTYEKDQDVTVLPGTGGINRALGNNVLELKSKDLLIMQFEAGESILDADKIKKSYPYKYTIKDIKDVLSAYENREEGKAIFVFCPIGNAKGKYIIDCATGKLLYGTDHDSPSSYIHEKDLAMLNDAIKKAEGGK
jgi:hypothetical protein